MLYVRTMRDYSGRHCVSERKQSKPYVQSKPVDCGVQGAACSLPGQGQSPCGLSRQSLDRIVKAEP